MAFIRKMVFQRKSNASPINLWNKILGQSKMRVFTTDNICGTRVIYDLWTCSCVDEYKRELRQHLKLWRKIRPFSASLNTKNDFRFHSGKFSKGKAILLCESVLWTSRQTLPLRAYLFTFAVFVAVIIYVQNGFSVGSYSLKCSHFSWTKSLWR